MTAVTQCEAVSGWRYGGVVVSGPCRTATCQACVFGGASGRHVPHLPQRPPPTRGEGAREGRFVGGELGRSAAGPHCVGSLVSADVDAKHLQGDCMVVTWWPLGDYIALYQEGIKRDGCSPSRQAHRAPESRSRLGRCTRRPVCGGVRVAIWGKCVGKPCECACGCVGAAWSCIAQRPVRYSRRYLYVHVDQVDDRVVAQQRREGDDVCEGACPIASRRVARRSKHAVRACTATLEDSAARARALVAPANRGMADRGAGCFD